MPSAVRDAARCACDAEQNFQICGLGSSDDHHPDSDPGISEMVTPRAQHVTAVKKHRTLRKRGRYWRAGRLDQPSYEELREAAEDHTKLYTMPSPVDRDRVMNCSTPDIRPAGKAATTSSRVLLRSGLRRLFNKAVCGVHAAIVVCLEPDRSG